jgi:hypothetical protein
LQVSTLNFFIFTSLLFFLTARVVEVDAASVADILAIALKKALCDRDPSVTSAALSLLHFVAKQVRIIGFVSFFFFIYI